MTQILKTPQALLSAARACMDPKEKHALLTQAAALDPRDLAVQREILLLGDLWQRDGRHPDVTLIKCHLLHGFEHPEQYDEPAQRRMARELMDHPQVRLCLGIANDGPGFLQEYLQTLSRQYIETFIVPARGHVPGLLGYVMPRRLCRYLSAPMADVIRGIFLCPFLESDEQRLLAGAFYRACYGYLEGRVQALDGNLGAAICALLA